MKDDKPENIEVHCTKDKVLLHWGSHVLFLEPENAAHLGMLLMDRALRIDGPHQKKFAPIFRLDPERLKNGGK